MSEEHPIIDGETGEVVEDENVALVPIQETRVAVADFQGISAIPFSDNQAKVLTESVDPELIEVRPDGLIYYPQIEYRRLLNKAFKPGGWALRPIAQKVIKNTVIYEGELWVVGRFVSRAVGEQEYHETNPNMSYATALESAKSDCLTRCCKDIGIAADLWNRRFVRKFLEKHAVEVWCEHVKSKQKKKLWRRKDDPAFDYPYREQGQAEKPPKPVAQNKDSAIEQAVSRKPESKKPLRGTDLDKAIAKVPNQEIRNLLLKEGKTRQDRENLIRKMVGAMALLSFPDNDKNTIARAQELLYEYSSFEGKEGPVEGFKSSDQLSKVSEGWLNTTYSKIKNEFLELFT